MDPKTFEKLEKYIDDIAIIKNDNSFIVVRTVDCNYSDNQELAEILTGFKANFIIIRGKSSRMGYDFEEISEARMNIAGWFRHPQIKKEDEKQG